MDPLNSSASAASGPLSMSPSIGKLAGALAKAQAAMKAPKKGRTAQIKSEKGSYSYNYADLADVIESYREHLSANGLSLSQPIIQRDGHLVLLTVLAHESGEWMVGEYPIPSFQRPQEQGSAITYARRYAVSSLLGIAAEDDDDGQRAQDAAGKREKKRQREEAPEPPPYEPKPEGDAGAILEAAAELAQHYGNVDAGTIIKEASKFTGSDGKERSFTDPGSVRSEKWLKSTHDRLQADLHKLRAKSEPGAAEAAELFQ